MKMLVIAFIMGMGEGVGTPVDYPQKMLIGFGRKPTMI